VASAVNRPPDHRDRTFVRDRLTILTYAMACAFGFALASLGPAMPSMRADLGISRTIGGLHFSAMAAGSVVSGFVVERIIDAWSRRTVFWLGGAGVAAGSLVIGAGPQPAVTLAGALAVGISGAAMLTTVQSTLADHHPTRRAVALTEGNTATSVGSALPALVIGASVAIGAGWRPAFLLPAAAWAVLVLTRRSEPIPEPPHRVGETGPRRLPAAYWLFWAALVPSVGAEWSIGAWGAGYLVDVAGTSDATASVLMTAFFGAMVAGRILGGRAARSVSPFPLLLGTSTVGMAGTLLLWGSASAAPVVAGLLVAGLGISMLFPMLLSLAMETAPDRSSTASARVFVAGGSAVLLAPVTLGAIADQTGIRPAFGIVPGLFLLVVGLAALGRRAASSAIGT
jgi:MFS family permease